MDSSICVSRCSMSPCVALHTSSSIICLASGAAKSIAFVQALNADFIFPTASSLTAKSSLCHNVVCCSTAGTNGIGFPFSSLGTKSSCGSGFMFAKSKRMLASSRVITSLTAMSRICFRMSGIVQLASSTNTACKRAGDKAIFSLPSPFSISNRNT